MMTTKLPQPGPLCGDCRTRTGAPVQFQVANKVKLAYLCVQCSAVRIRTSISLRLH